MISDILAPKEVVEYGASLLDPVENVLATGIKPWDEACDETGGRGLANWWYVVLGGASNAGKTQCMLYLARRAAESGLKPGVVTMEVPKRGLQRRVYSTITSFGYFDFLPDRWSQGDSVKRTTTLRDQVADYRDADLTTAKLSGAEARSLIVVEHERAPNLDEIIGACETLYDAGSRAVFVDHLQLIKAPADQIADRATEISEALRWFAHGKKCLVVALSQLNRMASRERDRRPTMHDLWGGTAIESNANQVMLVDHSYQERDPRSPHLMRTFLYLDKNREGPNRVLIPIEVNFKTGDWRVPFPDEEARWPS